MGALLQTVLFPSLITSVYFRLSLLFSRLAVTAEALWFRLKLVISASMIRVGTDLDILNTDFDIVSSFNT